MARWENAPEGWEEAVSRADGYPGLRAGPKSSHRRAPGTCAPTMLPTLTGPGEVGPAFFHHSFLKPVATGPVWRLVGLYI